MTQLENFTNVVQSCANAVRQAVFSQAILYAIWQRGIQEALQQAVC